MASKSGGGLKKPAQGKWGHKVTKTIPGPRTGIKVSKLSARKLAGQLFFFLLKP